MNEDNTNERLRQVYRTHHQGNPGLLQTLAVLIAEKLNMKKPPTTSIVRRASVSMPMDSEKNDCRQVASVFQVIVVNTFAIVIFHLHN